MIYFIQSALGGPVKIGFASNLFSRLSNIQSHSPEPLKLIGVMDGSRKEELELHSRFQTLRLRGEWFSFEGELRELVKTLPPAPKSPREIQRENMKAKKPTGPKGFRSREAASLLGSLGGKARAKKMKNGRMNEKTAKRIWLNAALSTDEAIDRMPGWTRETAYRYFKKRGRKPGPATATAQEAP